MYCQSTLLVWKAQFRYDCKYIPLVFGESVIYHQGPYLKDNQYRNMAQIHALYSICYDLQKLQ